MIFLFTLIPYIPIQGFQETLMELLATVLPESTNQMAFKTIDDIVNNPRGGLLSVGFYLSFILLYKWCKCPLYSSFSTLLTT